MADNLKLKPNQGALQKIVKRHPAFQDGPLNDKDLNAMAETIASGTRIEFRVR